MQHVRFTRSASVREYEQEEDCDLPHTPFPVRDAQERLTNERRVVRKPRTELENFRNLVSSWRDDETSVVLGNVGRQPHLLTYFLDLCFSHEDDIRVECAWPYPTPYQTGGSHFLILVEPYFGYCVQKPPDTEHLVVLTSHLNLTLGKPKMYYYHLPTLENAADSTLPDTCQVFRPPLFHVDPVPRLSESVLLDVRAQTLHEAYLRLLTGREMIGGRRFKLRMDNRKRLEMLAYANESRRRAEEAFHRPLDKVYWHGMS